MDKFKQIFKTRNSVIGVIHFAPLLGYMEYTNIDVILKRALEDIKSLDGVDAVFIENNYDYPHKITVGPETVACMSILAHEIVKKSKVPVGISVLWNDYKAALTIAKVSGAKFVRVPVFVDRVKTNYGEAKGEPKAVIAHRKSINAEEVLLFTDIQVKHAMILDKRSILASARLAIKNKSDGLIVTGKWTGDAPDLNELKKVRRAVGDFPILIGSGVDYKNVKTLLEYADGVIVSTSLKTSNTRDKVNIRGYQDKIDRKKVQNFMRHFKAVV